MGGNQAQATQGTINTSQTSRVESKQNISSTQSKQLSAQHQQSLFVAPVNVKSVSYAQKQPKGPLGLFTPAPVAGSSNRAQVSRMVISIPSYQDEKEKVKSDQDQIPLFNYDTPCQEDFEFHQSLKKAVNQNYYDLQPSIDKSQLEGYEQQKSKGIRGLLNQIFESKTLIGDDIYMMDKISADKYNMNPPYSKGLEQPQEQVYNFSKKQNDILSNGARMLWSEPIASDMGKVTMTKQRHVDVRTASRYNDVISASM